MIHKDSFSRFYKTRLVKHNLYRRCLLSSLLLAIICLFTSLDVYGNAWFTGIVDGSGNVGRYSSIATDSSRKLHISYYDSTNLDLKYATNASGSWVTTTVDSAGSVGSYTSIALDSSGKAHISYRDNTNYYGDLKYATNVSGVWVTTTLDDGGDVYDADVAIDLSDKVHIQSLS